MSRMPLGSLPQTSPGRVGGLVEKLTPGYFALVMASGIISIGLNLSGFRGLSIALLVVCIVSYVVLVVLNVWRFAGHRHAMIDDFRDPKRAFGFFTFVAGTNVLGTCIGGLTSGLYTGLYGHVRDAGHPDHIWYIMAVHFLLAIAALTIFMRVAGEFKEQEA